MHAARAAERRPPDADADAQVQQAQDAHGQDEEHERGDFEERPLSWLVVVEHGAERRLRYGLAAQIGAGLGRVRHVLDARVRGERQRTDERHQPNERHDPSGSTDAGHGVGVQRVADGEVPLQ